MWFVRCFSCLLSLVVILIMPANSVSEEDEWWKLKADDRAFSFTEFRKRAERVGSSLNNFADFTEVLIRNSNLNQAVLNLSEISDDQVIIFKIKGKDLKRFSMDLLWEAQYIGFKNRMTTIKRYGYISQNEILELRLENLKLKGASQKEIEQIQVSLDEQQKQLQDFLSKGIWVD